MTLYPMFLVIKVKAVIAKAKDKLMVVISLCS